MMVHQKSNMMTSFAVGVRRFASRPGSRRPVLRSLSPSANAAEALETRIRTPVRPGIVSPRRSVPLHIPRPPYVENGKVPEPPSRIEIKSAEQIAAMRRTCEFAALVRDYAATIAQVGVTTDYIDAMVHDFIIKGNAYPSPLNYKGFPKSLCTSVNEVLCHGIPDSRPLQEGDIVNLDITVYREGVHGDTSTTVCVGQVSDSAKDLVETCRNSLAEAIKASGPGKPFYLIGQTIDKFINRRYRIATIFAGHGIGTHFHGPPYIFHHANRYGADVVGGSEMRPGMVFTIEPILTTGSPREKIWSDGWTAATLDGGLSAQFEHTILITEHGAEILTTSATAGASA
ncbi:mitochondrial methionyl aminopeptidase [Andalucia godoyi]|uniref:Methionine aminopeptidase n=1 Tax=Andalucia godoyi TaxID=505711 RepID=A0A8K0F432_ANDGO|nr:mitochondrial methionyl aminopeptidase [Andalucia godoyi]|eukprot:ANDGO_07648.mRNA.1 mitochondrial methionyl aminopeptidase